MLYSLNFFLRFCNMQTMLPFTYEKHTKDERIFIKWNFLDIISILWTILPYQYNPKNFCIYNRLKGAAQLEINT